MACNISLAGIPRDCTGSLGGIREVYMIPYDDMGTFTFTDDIATAWTPKDSTVPSWYKYEFARNTGSATATATRPDAAGEYWALSVVLQFRRLDATKREEVEQLFHGEVAMIVKDSNGAYWLYGYDEGLTLADGSTAETGTAKGDFNGYNLTFSGDTLTQPMSVNEDVISSIYPS